MKVAGFMSGGGVRGIMLMECLAYLSLWMVVVGLGFGLFYRVYTQSKHLERATDDVVGVLRLGERWRAEVRGSGGVELGEGGAGGLDFVMASDAGVVGYRFEGTNIWRRGEGEGDWRPVFSGVERCVFHRDEVEGVLVWRWELELSKRSRHAAVVPRFTFQAVPGRREGEERL